ncbi:ATP-binding protein [Actinomadura rudentiformis]|uniref:AAA family ATPase n=1 Tax=Actinomadura rudentiformis TaxID=359158 RepID=A0A6H9YHE4_9ACTN|nr:AAA family ATPase [Actinomadura rudentiformis]KAB2345216.1 AAA family ATPase [Actinomadura rudentiformis]
MAIDGDGGMVGRGAELARLTALVEGVGDGRGGMLAVMGEAGIGKSRLLAEAARLAREAGLLVLTGRAVVGGGAYRPLAEALVGHVSADCRKGGDELRPYRAALGRVFPEWAGEEPPSSIDPVLVLGEGLVRLLGLLNGPRGCLLVLEDLHWADGDTLAVVEYLSGVLHSRPVLVAASIRDEDCPPWVQSRIVERPEVHTIRLRRLDEADSMVLAERCAGTVPLPAAVRDLVVRKSDGLPFLVEELVAGGMEERSVPPTLAGMVAARLDALGPEQRQVLEAAAVLGDEPDWTVLGKATGLAEDVVLDAARAAQPRLLVAAGDALRWRHALTRDAVLETVPPPVRAVLACRSAEVLLGRAGPEDDVCAAELLAIAGEQARAAEVFVRLARRDIARGALRDARDLLDRADGLASPSSAVAIERVVLLTRLGEADAALKAGARALGRTTGDEHARLCLRLADAAIVTGRWEEADRYLERAGRPEDPHALVLAANAAFGPGRLAEAAQLATAAIERAEAAHDGEALCRALLVLGQCAIRHDAEIARRTYTRAARLAAEYGLMSWRVTALNHLALVEVVTGAHTPALAEARELALENGQLVDVISADLVRSDQMSTIDGPRAAEVPAREAAELASRLRLTSHQSVGELFVALGRAADADADGMEAALDAATGRALAPVEVAALAPVIRGFIPLLDRDLETAVALFDDGMPMLEDQCQTAPVSMWGLWALLRSAVARDDAKVRDALRHSAPVLRNVNRGALHYADAIAAGRAGHVKRAASLLAAGDDALAHHHWWRRLCRSLVLEAAVTDGWGDPVPALRTDLAAFERTGEIRLARTTRDLLRCAGAPTRRGRGRTPVPSGLRAAGVTSREMDVLMLLTEGLTNRQIGERLFLSHRTVDTHVASLLAKTGTASRLELRAHKISARQADPQSLPKQGASSV